jgi:uncharacterized repeat protein (TIGR01451 family)
MKDKLWSAIAGALVLVVVSGLVTLFGPVQVSVRLGNAPQAADAAPAGDLPTTTPAPPTLQPAQPPTSTAVPPTSVPPTDVPPTDAPPSTAVPPTHVPVHHKPPTPTALTATPDAPPATAVVAPPPQESGPPDVAIQKEVNNSTAQRGDRLTFTLVARNQGQVAAHDVVVTDAVPAVFQITDLASSKGDIAHDGQNVSAYPRDLSPGETATIRITVQVRADAAIGPLDNMALITTSTPGDNPGNNTSTVTVTIAAPPMPMAAPPRLPVTADPDLPQSFLAIYWPLLVLAFAVLFLGAAFRMGLFHRRTLVVALSRPGFATTVTPTSTQPVQGTPSLVAGIDVDPTDIIARWRSGIPLDQIVSGLTATHPEAEPVLIMLAVQRLIDETLA